MWRSDWIHRMSLDEQVLRQYTKIAKKWEDNGRNIYHLSSAVGIPAIPLLVNGGNELFGENVGFWILASLYLWDITYNAHGLMGEVREQDTTDGAVSLNLSIEFYKKVNRYVRLPTFLSGAVSVGISTYGFINYFVNGGPFDNTTWESLTFGAGLLGLASSMYIKDRNPKLLDKEPFLKTAYNWFKEKFDFLTPQPAPQPAPAIMSARLSPTQELTKLYL